MGHVSLSTVHVFFIAHCYTLSQFLKHFSPELVFVSTFNYAEQWKHNPRHRENNLNSTLDRLRRVPEKQAYVG